MGISPVSFKEELGGWSHKRAHFSLQSLDQEIATPSSLPSASQGASLSIGFTDLNGTFAFGPCGNVTRWVLTPVLLK